MSINSFCIFSEYLPESTSLFASISSGFLSKNNTYIETRCNNNVSNTILQTNELLLDNNSLNQTGGNNYSKIYVFNKLINIIEKINFSSYDNKIHIYIDDKKF